MKSIQILALLRLQLILLRRAWATPSARTIQIFSFLLSGVMALSLGGILGWLVILLTTFAQQDSLQATFSQWLFLLLWGAISVIWLIAPLLFVIQHEHLHLDPQSLLIYPLSFFNLYAMYTFTGLLEPWSLFFYPLLLGLCGGALVSIGARAILPLLLLFVIFTAIQVVWSRLLVHLFDSLLRSRKGRESGTLVLIAGLLLLAFVPAFIGQALETHPEWQSLLREPQIVSSLHLPLNLLLSFSPPGLATGVLLAAIQGHMVESLSALGGLCCWLCLGICCGQALFRQFITQPPVSTGPQRRWSLWQTDLLAFLDYRTALLVKKDLRTLQRSVLGKLCFLLTPSLLLLIRLLTPLPPRSTWPSTLLLIGSMGYIFTINLFLFCNFFALDGPGFKHYLTAPVPIGTLIQAKHLALGCFVSLDFLCVLYLYQAFFVPISLETLCFVLLAFATVLLGVLSMGTFLSIRFASALDLNQSRVRQSATPLMLAFQFLSLFLLLPALAQALAQQAHQPRCLVMAFLLGLTSLSYVKLLPAQEQLFREQCLVILEAVGSTARS